MKRLMHGVVVVVLSSCGIAQAGPVLLATIENEWVGSDIQVIDEYAAGDRLLYEIYGDPRFGDLFEDIRVTVFRDEPPILHNASMSISDDPDFELVASLLTDGKSLGAPDTSGFQQISVLGLIGSESLLNIVVPRVSAQDLLGYNIERIDREIAFSIESPSDGSVGTILRVNGIYEFYGTPVPEPGTIVFMLMACIPIALIRFRTGPVS